VEEFAVLVVLPKHTSPRKSNKCFMGLKSLTVLVK